MKIGIVGHVSRIVEAQALRESVAADYISIDRSGIGCVDNHRAVWNHIAAVAQPDEWCIVLEDDSIVASDFRIQAEAVLSHTPNGVVVVSFYLGRMRPAQWREKVKQAVGHAQREQAHWIVGDACLHGVAVAMTGKHALEMLHETRSKQRAFDEAITLWSRKFQYRVGYCYPSIVNHADGPSVIDRHPDGQRRERGRVAWVYGSRETWTGRAVLL
jgi:GR25 family glycosyltransferase involved in LPS biosynthesis